MKAEDVHGMTLVNFRELGSLAEALIMIDCAVSTPFKVSTLRLGRQVKAEEGMVPFGNLEGDRPVAKL